jgi:hypothetical protein
MPVAIPWYRSRIMQGLLTVLVTQLIKHVQGHYNVDISVWGSAVPDIVNGTMDGVGLAALAWAGHARVAPRVPIPQVVTLTKAGADHVNSDSKP